MNVWFEINGSINTLFLFYHSLVMFYSGRKKYKTMSLKSRYYIVHEPIHYCWPVTERVYKAIHEHSTNRLGKPQDSETSKCLT